MPISLQQLQALVSGQGENQNLIYNRYQRSDYSVGQDNLNPQRELKLTDAEMLEDIENMRARLYGMYRERLEALRAQSGTTATLPSDLGLAYDDREEIQTPLTLQETVTAQGDDHTPELEIEKMLGALSGLLGGDLLTDGDLPFDICAGINDDFDTFDPTQYDELRNRGGGGDGSSAGSGSGAGSGGGQGSGSAGGGGASAASDDMDCLVQELTLLKILLMLIQIMQVAARVQQLVLTVVFMATRAATLIAQAWVNPTAIAELVQELANMGVAFLAEGIQQIIKAIWDSLNLDCLMKGSLAKFRGVMGNIGAVADVGSRAGSFLTLNNQMIDEVGRTGAFLKDAFTSRSLRDVLTDNGTLGDLDAVAVLRNTPTMTALRSMDAVRKINSAKAGLARAWAGGAEQAIDISSTITSEMAKTGSYAAGQSARNAAYEGRGLRAQADELNERATRGYYHKYDDEGNVEETVQLSQRQRDRARTEAANLTKEAQRLEDQEARAREAQQAIDSAIDQIAETAASARDGYAEGYASTVRRVSNATAALLGNADAVDPY